MTERFQNGDYQFVRPLSVSLEGITQEERELSDKLIEAAIAIAPIYALQQNDNYLGANFYPHDVSNQEIEKAASINHEILSPYTFVEKKSMGLSRYLTISNIGLCCKKSVICFIRQVRFLIKRSFPIILKQQASRCYREITKEWI